jgi:hypothetical protein
MISGGPDEELPVPEGWPAAEITTLAFITGLTGAGSIWESSLGDSLTASVN